MIVSSVGRVGHTARADRCTGWKRCGCTDAADAGKVRRATGDTHTHPTDAGTAVCRHDPLGPVPRARPKD